MLLHFKTHFSKIRKNHLFSIQSVRWLNLHEYQSKQLLQTYHIRVQKGDVASNPENAFKIASKLKNENAKDLILKAQILAGGRGKGHFDTGFKGGVHVVQTPEKIKSLSSKMFNHNLITKQTSKEGQKVSKVLIHEGVDFDKEYYFAILLDRSTNGPVFVGSPMGGMDIEEVARKSPDQILTIPIDIINGPTNEQTQKMAHFLGFKENMIADACEQMQSLYKMFVSEDATQIEINPLVSTKDNKVYCVDAKLNFDDNASFRHKNVFSLRDTSLEDPREVEADKHNLNYIGLDGNIGCMVNGAGLAMATMDIIKLNNGNPANFLDVGGGATEEQVFEAFKILVRDSHVKAILVNIFGGIMRCDVIASGIVQAAKNIRLDIPIVVRLEGTRVEEGKKILKDSKLRILSADDLDDAAKKVVEVC